MMELLPELISGAIIGSTIVAAIFVLVAAYIRAWWACLMLLGYPLLVWGYLLGNYWIMGAGVAAVIAGGVLHDRAEKSPLAK